MPIFDFQSGPPLVEEVAPAAAPFALLAASSAIAPAVAASLLGPAVVVVVVLVSMRVMVSMEVELP